MPSILNFFRNFFKNRFTPTGLLFVTLLSIAFLGFIQRAIYDIARLYIPGDLNYLSNPNIIFMHAIIVLLMIVFALVFANIFFKKSTDEVTVMVVPYCLVCIFMIFQLGFEIVVFLFTKHPTVGIYVCLLSFLFFCGFNLFRIKINKTSFSNKLKDLIYIPKTFLPKEEIDKEEEVIIPVKAKFTMVKTFFNIVYIIAFVFSVSFFLYILFKFW